MYHSIGILLLWYSAFWLGLDAGYVAVSGSAASFTTVRLAHLIGSETVALCIQIGSWVVGPLLLDIGKAKAR